MKIRKLKIENSAGGFGLVEVVIVTAIITVSLFAFMQAGILALRLLRGEKENLELSIAAGEALEAVRALRDESWSANIETMTASEKYYPQIENGKWMLSSAPTPLLNGRYTRYIVLEDVYRDANDRITVGGTLDPDTKKITATATSTEREKVLVSYITNFRSLMSSAGEAISVSFTNATTDDDLGSFPSDDAGDGDPAQTFTTSSAIDVKNIELYLKRATADPSDIYIELREDTTGAVLGTSRIITGSTISDSALTWVSFRFPDAVSLSASTQYAIRLRSKPLSTDAGSGSAGSINWGYLQSSGSPYAGGDAYRYVGKLSNPADTGQLMDQYDFGFRVYGLQ